MNSQLVRGTMKMREADGRRYVAGGSSLYPAKAEVTACTKPPVCRRIEYSQAIGGIMTEYYRNPDSGQDEKRDLPAQTEIPDTRSLEKLRQRVMSVDGLRISLPPLIGTANDDGVCKIGLPPHSTFSLSAIRSEFIYIVMFGRLKGMPEDSLSDCNCSTAEMNRNFRPGDILDTRNPYPAPLTMETTTWTELARLPYARLSGDTVRRLRRDALDVTSVHNAAQRALQTSRKLVNSTDTRNSPRLTSLSGWRGNGPEPMLAAMMRDPIIQLVMQSDGISESDVLFAVSRLRRLQ